MLTVSLVCLRITPKNRSLFIQKKIVNSSDESANISAFVTCIQFILQYLPSASYKYSRFFPIVSRVLLECNKRCSTKPVQLNFNFSMRFFIFAALAAVCLIQVTSKSNKNGNGFILF